MKSSVVAVGSLFLAGALIPVVGAALFVFFLLGQFLLALVGVIGGQSNRTVKQHEPSMNLRGWREEGGIVRRCRSLRSHCSAACSTRAPSSSL